jgi:hypothetical protein
MNDLLALLMDNWMLIAAGLGGGFIGLLVSYKEIGKVFRVLGTGRSEIGALMVDEQVEVVGNADGDSVLQSPIRKQACVLWQIQVDELRSSGKNSRWVTVYNNRSTTPFDVYDASGRVRVQPGAQTELWLNTDQQQTSGLFSALDEQTQSVLNELNITTKGLLNMNKRMRVYECYIEKGDQVFLLGRVSLQNGVKTLDGNVPLIVSDRSELALLGKYIGQLLLSSLLGAFFGGMIYFFVINR